MEFNFDFAGMKQNLQPEKGSNYKKYEADSRFWKLSKNENGVGLAIIRLLPDRKNTPWVRLYGYSLKKPNPVVPGKYLWYIANSPDTINLPDPVKEKYTDLMKSGSEEDKAKAKILRRNTKFYTNILVVKDPANPENDGKVFLWEYGTKVNDKINAWLTPSDDEVLMGQKPKEVYNPIMGHNIKLKIAPQGEFSTYDGSEVISDITGIKEGITREEAIEFITTKTYDLGEFLAPEYYESYDVLASKFYKWFGDSEAPRTKSAVSNETKKVAEEPKREAPVATTSVDDDDNWMDDL